jgi:hypothetical protein
MSAMREEGTFRALLASNSRGFAGSRAAAVAFAARVLEHVPEKWTRFSDKDMLQVFELARILFDQVIPPDRKAR